MALAVIYTVGEIQMAQHPEYSKGYSAGKRFHEKQLKSLLDEIARLQANQETKDERVFMKSLGIALEHCSDWTIGNKKMISMKNYCELARVMADNAIEVIKR